MDFRQPWPKPVSSLPIVIIGAGGIVVDSHMPAYRQAGYEVSGIWNRRADRARTVADQFGIPRVFTDLAEVARQVNVIIDIATSPHRHIATGSRRYLAPVARRRAGFDPIADGVGSGGDHGNPDHLS